MELGTKISDSELKKYGVSSNTFQNLDEARKVASERKGNEAIVKDSAGTYSLYSITKEEIDAVMHEDHEANANVVEFDVEKGKFIKSNQVVDFSNPNLQEIINSFNDLQSINPDLAGKLKGIKYVVQNRASLTPENLKNIIEEIQKFDTDDNSALFFIKETIDNAARNALKDTWANFNDLNNEFGDYLSPASKELLGKEFPNFTADELKILIDDIKNLKKIPKDGKFPPEKAEILNSIEGKFSELEKNYNNCILVQTNIETKIKSQIHMLDRAMDKAQDKGTLEQKIKEHMGKLDEIKQLLAQGRVLSDEDFSSLSTNMNMDAVLKTAFDESGIGELTGSSQMLLSEYNNLDTEQLSQAGGVGGMINKLYDGVLKPQNKMREMIVTKINEVYELSARNLGNARYELDYSITQNPELYEKVKNQLEILKSKPQTLNELDNLYKAAVEIKAQADKSKAYDVSDLVNKYIKALEDTSFNLEYSIQIQKKEFQRQNTGETIEARITELESFLNTRECKTMNLEGSINKYISKLKELKSDIESEKFVDSSQLLELNFDISDPIEAVMTFDIKNNLSQFNNSLSEVISKKADLLGVDDPGIKTLNYIKDNIEELLQSEYFSKADFDNLIIELMKLQNMPILKESGIEAGRGNIGFDPTQIDKILKNVNYMKEYDVQQDKVKGILENQESTKKSCDNVVKNLETAKETILSSKGNGAKYFPTLSKCLKEGNIGLGNLGAVEDEIDKLLTMKRRGRIDLSPQESEALRNIQDQIASIRKTQAELKQQQSQMLSYVNSIDKEKLSPPALRERFELLEKYVKDPIGNTDLANVAAAVLAELKMRSDLFTAIETTTKRFDDPKIMPVINVIRDKYVKAVGRNIGDIIQAAYKEASKDGHVTKEEFTEIFKHMIAEKFPSGISQEFHKELLELGLRDEDIQKVLSYNKDSAMATILMMIGRCKNPEDLKQTLESYIEGINLDVPPETNKYLGSQNATFHKMSETLPKLIETADTLKDKTEALNKYIKQSDINQLLTSIVNKAAESLKDTDIELINEAIEKANILASRLEIILLPEDEAFTRLMVELLQKMRETLEKLDDLVRGLATAMIVQHKIDQDFMDKVEDSKKEALKYHMTKLDELSQKWAELSKKLHPTL